jgi:hypothetical protein
MFILNNNIQFYFEILIILITDAKYCLINSELNLMQSFMYMDGLNNDTIIIKNKQYNIDNVNEIFTDVTYINDDKCEEFVNHLLKNKTKNIDDIFKNYKIAEDFNNYVHIDLSVNDFKYVKNNNNPLIIILERFGIISTNYGEYEIIIDKHNNSIIFDDNIIINDKTKKKTNFKLFILNDNDKYTIELNIKNNNGNYYINLQDCYFYYDDKKNLLIFHKFIDGNSTDKYLFMNCVPYNSPYILYKKENDYIMHIIINKNYYTNDDNLSLYNKIYNSKYFKLKEEFKNINNRFYTLKFCPSIIFPTLDSLENENNKINKYLKNKDKVILDSFRDIIILYNLSITKINIDVPLNTKFIIQNTYLNKNINDILNLIKTLINESIISEQENDEKFIRLIKNEKINETDKLIFFKQFIENRHDCTKVDKKVCELKSLKLCDNYITQLKHFLQTCLTNIKQKYKFSDLLITNLELFVYIMKINLALKILTEINDNQSCWDFQKYSADINNILLFDKYEYKLYDIIFLLQNQYFFTKQQINKYNEIKQDINDNNNRLKLHQLMMGKGKTSVITPLIALFIKLEKIKIPTIITTPNLVKQTKKYLYIMKMLLNYDFNVFSDNEYKKRWIENIDITLLNGNKPNIDFSNEINIIDEFDTHHNYLQSNFNYVSSSILYITNDIYRYIFDFVYNKIHNIYYFNISDTVLGEISKKIFTETLDNVYLQITNMIYNKDYGFYTKDLNNKICIPYIRKDTPSVGSNFSNVILRLMLTFNIYIRNFNINLEEIDFEILAKNNSIVKKIEIFDDIKDFYDLLEKIDLGIIDKNNLYIYIKNNYEKKDIKKKIEITINYLYEINLENIKNTKEQINVSFQDIIYNNNFQVGYTGTTYLHLNNYEESDINVFKEKIPDYDESLEILLALNQYGKKTAVPTIYYINKNSTNDQFINKIIEILQKEGNIPRGLVDLANTFIDYNNRDIASNLKNKLPNNKIIYISSDNRNLEYSDNNDKDFMGIDLNNFYYYDQGHTIGTDIVQPPSGDVVILINKDTKLSDFTQGIFRFRKINRGTIIHILYVYENENEVKEIQNILNIEALLRINEDKFNKNQELGLKYQLIKAVSRKIEKNYTESYLKPAYINDKELKDICLINIKGITRLKKYYKDIYDRFFEKDNIDKLYELIFNTGKQQETQQEMEQEQEQEQQSDKQKNYENQYNLTNLDNFLSNYKYNIRYPEHYNCDICDILNFVKFFNIDNDIKINKKNVYVSYNLLQKNKKDFDNNTLCFVEFDDKIIIEVIIIAFPYYFDILPIYDYNGKLLNPKMINKTKSVKLQIDPVFVEILGLQKYYIIGEEHKKIENIDVYINQIAPNVLSLLLVHLSYKQEFELLQKKNIIRFNEYIFNNKMLELAIENFNTNNLFTKTNINSNLQEKLNEVKDNYNNIFDTYNKNIRKKIYDKLLNRFAYFYTDDKYNEIKGFLFVDLIMQYAIILNNIKPNNNILHNNKNTIRKKYINIYNYINQDLVNFDFNIKLEKKTEKYEYKLHLLTFTQSFYNSIFYINFLNEIYNFDKNNLINRFDKNITELLYLINELQSKYNINDVIKIILNLQNELDIIKHNNLKTKFNIILSKYYLLTSTLIEPIEKQFYLSDTIYKKILFSRELYVVFNNNLLIDYISLLRKEDLLKMEKQKLNQILPNSSYKKIISIIKLLTDNLDKIFVLTETEEQFLSSISGGNNDIYKQKYIKYKLKYLNLKKIYTK